MQVAIFTHVYYIYYLHTHTHTHKNNLINKRKFFLSLFPPFPLNVNSELLGIGLEQKLFLSCKNICFETIQNEGTIQTVLQAWTEMSSNFWWRSENRVRFTEECVIGAEKHVLVQKVFTNGLIIVLPLWPSVKIHWLSSEGKVPLAAVSKEGHVDSLL